MTSETYSEYSERAHLYSTDNVEEPPLLEELGIDFDHILRKTLHMMNHGLPLNEDVVKDEDLAGPFIFISSFGGLLMISGRFYCSYVYLTALMVCLGMYVLLNLISLTSISLASSVSVLGYGFFPMIVLSAISVLFPLNGMMGTLIAAYFTYLSSRASGRVFAKILLMEKEPELVIYPCALMYGYFALLVLF